MMSHKINSFLEEAEENFEEQQCLEVWPSVIGLIIMSLDFQQGGNNKNLIKMWTRIAGVMRLQHHAVTKVL